ncbi:DnaD domain-containing protein [Nicoliella lavandulae]|uniref:DnaD domain protein n=1 Tax=Nicoliella lavandulae TaxID=3082954 RepID=A0ABU8SM76_9LACO
MSKLRKKYKEKYTVILNTVIEDKRLSYKALGLFLDLWHSPDDWDYYLSEIVKRHKDGKESVSSGLKELEKFGYLRRSNKHRNENGTFDSYDWDFSEIGEFIQSGKPAAENHRVGKPAADNQPLQNTNSTKYLKSLSTEGTNLSRKQVTRSERDKKPTKLELAKKLWTKQMNPKLVDYAADLAKRNAKYELSYFNKLMQDWQDKGYETIEDTKQTSQSSYGNPKPNKDLRPTWMKKGLDKQVVEPVSEEERAKVIAHIEAIRSKGKTKGDDVS